MKLYVLALAFSLVPAASSLAQSQDEKDKQRRQAPPQEEPKRQDQPSGERQQDRDKPPQDREKQDREKRDKDQQERDKQQKQQDRERQDRNRVQQGQAAPRDRSPEHAGHRGGRIPDDRFRASFGPEHRFRVHPQGGGRVEGGQGQRFQYSGYWFELVEPWPSAWSYDDDCYVDYIDDDYYLFDEMHPGYRVLIIVVE